MTSHARDWTAMLLAGLMLAAPGARAQSPNQSAGLRIVVIAGEDAVNVIQQGTAVAPLVEVRDRNDLPVAGAVVAFSSDGRATFAGGLRSVTITTDTAGRAASTALTPVRNGRVRIQVRATYQGQTATTVIRQVNVAAVADASAALAGGGAAGGGLSALTLGAIVGGGATATLIGVHALSRDTIDTTPLPEQPALPSTLTGQFSGAEVFIVSPPGCQITAANSGSVTITITSRAGTTISGSGTFVRSITNPSAPCGGFAVTGAAAAQFSLGTFTTTNGSVQMSQATTGSNGTSSATNTYTFSGQVIGTEIAGTFTYTSVTTFAASPLTVSGSMSVPVTLR